MAQMTLQRSYSASPGTGLMPSISVGVRRQSTTDIPMHFSGRPKELLFCSVSGRWSSCQDSHSEREQLFKIGLKWKRNPFAPPRITVRSENELCLANRDYIYDCKQEKLFNEPDALQNELNDLGFGLKRATDTGCMCGKFAPLSRKLIERILHFVLADDCGRLACSSRQLLHTVRGLSSLWWRYYALEEVRIANKKVKGLLRRKCRIFVVDSEEKTSARCDESGDAFDSFVTARLAVKHLDYRFELQLPSAGVGSDNLKNVYAMQRLENIYVMPPAIPDIVNGIVNQEPLAVQNDLAMLADMPAFVNTVVKQLPLLLANQFYQHLEWRQSSFLYSNGRNVGLVNSIEWASLRLDEYEKEDVIVSSVLAEVAVQHIGIGQLGCQCALCRLKHIYTVEKEVNGRKRLAYSTIIQQSPLLYNDPNDRVALLATAKRHLSPSETCVFHDALLHSMLAVQEKQFRFDFQTRPRGSDGQWWTAMLNDDHNGEAGDLDQHEEQTFRNMQVLDRLILFYLLGLMNNMADIGWKNRARKKQYLTFVPCILNGSSSIVHDSIFILYQRHKIQLPGKIRLMENHVNELGASVCDLHLEFPGQTTFVTAVAKRTMPLSAVIKKAYMAISGKELSLEGLTVLRVTVEAKCDKEFPGKWDLHKFEEGVKLHSSVEEASLASGDCLRVSIEGTGTG